MSDRDVGEGRFDDHSTDRLLGELIAEIRAVKHNQNNSLGKLDAVNSLAGSMKEAIRRLEKIEREQESQNLRLAVLEADKHRREGAVGLVAWLSRNWPVPFFLALAATFVAWANDKLRIP